MTDPISARTSPLAWPDYAANETPLKQAAERSTSTEAEVASLYYQSSIQSLTPPP